MATYEESDGYLLAVWDCRVCDRKKIPGDIKYCPGCGIAVPNSPDIYYLPDDAVAITEVAAITQAEVGPNWECSYCNAANPGDASCCQGCGAGKDGSRAFHHDRRGTDEAARPAERDPQGRWYLSPPRTDRPVIPGRRSLALPSAVAALLAVCFGWLLWNLFVTADISFRVVGFSWERSVTISELRTHTDEGWTVPAGGRVLRTRSKHHHDEDVVVGERVEKYTKSVQVGTEKVRVGTEMKNLGNGRFEKVGIYEERPVMKDKKFKRTVPVTSPSPVSQTWYQYETDNWVTVANPRVRGTDHKPGWPVYTLGPNQRAVRPEETYTLHLEPVRGDKAYTYRLDQSQWQAYQEGMRITGTVNGFGNLIRISPPPVVAPTGAATDR
ncbi:hypothetical protein HY523_02075 [Candidatus Berkelbacteria bacterium]|nr:hypothetical protein [Candidatus Berkelbacteria bacterium]